MATFVNDTFTDTDATLLESHTRDDGGSWAKHPTSVKAAGIWGNRADGENSNGLVRYLASGTPASAEYDISATMVMASTAQISKASLMGRYNATQDTGYRIEYTAAGTWTLFKMVNGVSTSLGTYSYSPALNSSTPVVLHIRDAKKSADINGVVDAISSTNNDVTAAGAAGIGFYQRGFGGTAFGQKWDSYSAADPAASGVSIQPGTASLVLTGNAPSLLVPVTIRAGTASITLTGNAPVLKLPIVIRPGTASLTLTGNAPGIQTPIVLQPGTGALVLSGNAPGIDISSGGLTIRPGTAQLTLTGNAPGLLVPVAIQPGTASLILTGGVPVIVAGATGWMSLDLTCEPVLTLDLAAAAMGLDLAAAAELALDLTCEPGA